MRELQDNNRLFTILGNWDWLSQKLKERFGQLRLADIAYEVGKENDLLNRIGIRLDKSRGEVIYILKKAHSF